MRMTNNLLGIGADNQIIRVPLADPSRFSVVTDLTDKEKVLIERAKKPHNVGSSYILASNKNSTHIFRWDPSVFIPLSLQDYYGAIQKRSRIHSR